MALRFVEVVVDAEHHVERFGAGHLPLHGAGHHHPLEPQLIEVGVEGVGGLEAAAALQHHLHAGLTPGHGGGDGVLAVGDGLLPHPEAVVVGVHGLVPAAVHRIEGQQMGGGGGITAAVVDVHDLNAGPAPEGAEHQPSDAAEAVDPDAHGPVLQVAPTLDQRWLMHQVCLIWRRGRLNLPPTAASPPCPPSP